MVKLWLKDRVQLLLDHLESTADKLSDCWLFIDQNVARTCVTDSTLRHAALIADAKALLRRQACPGWKEGQ